VQLGAEPGEGRAVVAGEKAVDAPRDRELERLEALGGDRPGARPRGRPLAAGCASSTLPWSNSAAMSILSPLLMRASLSKVGDIRSFSIFDRVEAGSPVRLLTSASVQPCLRRSALSAAPGCATPLPAAGCALSAASARSGVDLEGIAAIVTGLADPENNLPNQK